MSLRRRMTLTGVAVVVATVAVMAALTYATIRARSTSAVDDTLRREAERIAVSFPSLLDEAAGGDDELSEGELVDAVQRVLAANPGSVDHLSAISSAAGTFTTADAPPPLDELRDDGQIPLGETGTITTADTSEGPIRLLRAELVSGGRMLGQLSVLAPLQDARDDARDSLAVIAVTGTIAVVLGGAAIALATRRSLRSLHEVAASAGGIEVDLTSRVPDRGSPDEVDTLARELNRMLDRLADATERRQALLDTVSHELRTPLAVARGHIDVFRNLDADPGSPAADLAATLDDELARISRLVDDLSALGRGELQQQIEMGPVFVPDLLDDLRNRVDALGLANVTVGAAAPAVIEVDSGRVAQSLLNLVVNASTHTPPETVIEVAADAREDVVRFSVRDDGPGIDPSIRDTVFEPFVSSRVDDARRTGLGMAVVRALTEAQGGCVQLETGPSGTTVTLVFPRDD